MNKLKILLTVAFSIICGLSVKAQQVSKTFTKADSLRGMLTPLRTCYDLNYYHLSVKVNVEEKLISGSNLFRFTAVQDFKSLQFDLFDNLKVEKVVYKGAEVPFRREYHAVCVDFRQTIRKGTRDEFTVFYSGSPTIARNPPWDGGFVFSKDLAGKPWVAVACQEIGASLWWPNKDHQSDEVDSMLISISVPPGLMDVSNGRLRSVQKLPDGYSTYNWFVSYPINNYTVALNIGDYVHFDDSYKGLNGNLSLDYYVLRENLEKAKVQFTADVKPMLQCFEHWFGPYPFYRDGYKLIDGPFLGMENQTAVAYGNKYQKGYLGRDLSGTGLGLTWDYIIVHESGHEWFGNNVTSKDIADMWIHEGFTMYSEGLFVECKNGKDAGARYIAGIRKRVQNKTPVIGAYDVNSRGSNDMYDKGANLLHTVRTIINNDEKWRSILQGLNKTFALKTTTTLEVVNYINDRSGKNLTKVFDQYLKYPGIPVLELKKEKQGKVSYRWVTDVKDFDMPVRVKVSATSSWQFITPSNNWKSVTLKAGAKELLVDTDNFYIKTNLL